MRKYYALGIILMVLALNIPEVSEDIRSNITFYSPAVVSRLSSARNVIEPAAISIIEDLQAKTTINGKFVPSGDVDSSDDWSLTHGNSITAEQFDSILRDYNSPAVGVGIPITAYAKEKSIDNAYALYIFIHESTAGTNSNWNADTKNPGNIICAGYPSCIGRFRQYARWDDGFKDLIDLLVIYRDKNGIKTIDTAIEKWSPPSENDTNGYIETLHKNVHTWRALNLGEFVASGDKGVIQQWKPITRAKGAVTSTPLPLSGCIETNVTAVYNNSIGIREFVIPAGKDWSFNENWIIVNPDDYYCYGVPYGSICDMAGRYSNAAHQLGLETEYTYHGFNLTSLNAEDSTSIWSSGTRGGQDLVIKNNTDKKAEFRAYINNGEFIVTATFI